MTELSQCLIKMPRGKFFVVFSSRNVKVDTFRNIFFSFFCSVKVHNPVHSDSAVSLDGSGFAPFLQSRTELFQSSNFDLADKILTFRVFQIAARALHT